MSRLFQAVLVVATLALGLLPGVARGQKLHALLVSDQSPAAKWGTYAPHVSMDIQRMSWMLRDNLPTSLQQTRTLVITRDRDATPVVVLAALERIDPEPEDTVLFYYTGHGAADEQGHYLALRGGPLYRQTIREAIERKGPRLAVILTDCCNLRGDGRRMIAMAPAPPEPPMVPPPLLRSLLFDSRGVVDVNASAPGEAAYFVAGSEDLGIDSLGSLFTRAVSRYVEEHLDQERTWKDLLTDVSFQVHVGFREGYPTGAKALDGRDIQRDQNVYAVDYPGKPASEGSRMGIVFMDGPSGVEIMQLQPHSPGERVFDLGTQDYVALRPGERIVAANGRRIERLSELADVVQTSPQVMRIRVIHRDGESREYLIRLRY